MPINSGMMSSTTNEWATPQDFFNNLDREFQFTLDPCCTDENHKCPTYFTQKEDGLSQSWSKHIVFCNPPYGREIAKWVKKCSEEINREDGAEVIVLLIPSRTDTRYFHDYLYQKQNVELRFIKGRLKFGDSKNSAPFPSLVAVMRKESSV